MKKLHSDSRLRQSLVPKFPKDEKMLNQTVIRFCLCDIPFLYDHENSVVQNVLVAGKIFRIPQKKFSADGFGILYRLLKINFFF